MQLDVFLFPSGLNETLRAVSPSTIIFYPPDPLVIEIETAGRYSDVTWLKDSHAPGTIDGFPNSFTHFKNIYYVPRSYRANQGRYVVELVTYYVPPRLLDLPRVEFNVIAYGKVIVMAHKHVTIN